MDTASYVARPRHEETFAPCQRWAGRATSQTAARKSNTSAEVFEDGDAIRNAAPRRAVASSYMSVERAPYPE